jgi:hypothetical protein
MYCHHWPVRAVERFTGPFNHTLQNKIMVIGEYSVSRRGLFQGNLTRVISIVGNLYDPITPFISAKAVADALGNSAVLLKHNGYGVCVYIIEFIR